jgi:hypothetical protein
VTLGPETATMVESPVADPAATVSASTAAWVRAFAPAQDMSGLKIDGDHDLVHGILADLAQESIQTSARERVEIDQTAVAEAAAA